MRVSEAVNSRRSMRVFKPDPVAKADIEWIIENANRSASNGNLQPWKLYVTMGAARKRLSAAILSAMDVGDNGPGAEYNVYPQEMTPVYDTRRKLVGKQLYTLLGVPRAATGYEIKRAYLALRKSFDPAKVITPKTLDLVDSIRLISEVIDEAYEILRDPVRRDRYSRAITARPEA